MNKVKKKLFSNTIQLNDDDKHSKKLFTSL